MKTFFGFVKTQQSEEKSIMKNEKLAKKSKNDQRRTIRSREKSRVGEEKDEETNENVLNSVAFVFLWAQLDQNSTLCVREHVDRK